MRGLICLPNKSDNIQPVLGELRALREGQTLGQYSGKGRGGSMSLLPATCARPVMGTLGPGEAGPVRPSNWSQDGNSEERRLALNWDEVSRAWVWNIPWFMFL